MSSTVHYTLEQLEIILATMQQAASVNVTSLEQAIEAMRQGKVGESVLGEYAELMDLAEALRDAAHGTDQALDPNRDLRDVRSQVPDAGDNAFLTGD